MSPPPGWTPGEASDLGSAAGTERPGNNLPTHHPLHGWSPEPLRSSAHNGRGQDGSEWEAVGSGAQPRGRVRYGAGSRTADRAGDQTESPRAGDAKNRTAPLLSL